MQTFYIEEPRLLYLLLPTSMLVATGFYWWLNFVGRHGLRSAYAHEEHLARNTSPLSLTSAGELCKLLSYNIIAILLAICLSWPVAKTLKNSGKAGDLCILGVLDVSGSMRADPYRKIMTTKTGGQPVGEHGTNLQMALKVHFEQVVKAAGRNRFALLTFNTEAELKTPFCEDMGAIGWLLRTKKLIGIGQAPGNGSDYNAGLASAAQCVINNYDRSKRYFLVLYSDGGWKGDRAARQKAIDTLTSLGVHLIVVGLGSRAPQRVPLYVGERWVDDAPYGQNPKSMVQLDEAALQDLVKTYGANAEYVPMDPESSARIDQKWWRAKFTTRREDDSPEPVFEYFLLPALVLWSLLLTRGRQERPGRP